MTVPNIPELRRLLTKATPGPWRNDRYNIWTHNQNPATDAPIGCWSTADARAIVALRNDAPALLDLLDDMAATLSHKAPYSKALARYRAMCGEP